MNKTPFLIAICLLSVLTGCQQPVGVQRSSMFGLADPSQMFSEASRPQWLGGTAKNPNFFASNKNARGIQLPNDPDQQAEWFNSLADQVQTLNGRLGQFDSDNQQLHTELASYRQKLQAAGDYNYQLKQQLTDSIAQIKQFQNDKLNLEQQLAAARLGGQGSGNGMLAGSGGAAVPSQLPGSAVLRANNSLLQQLPQLRIPGVSAQMDGDVIRVEIPSDPLFVPGTYQISNQHGTMLQELATAINRNFPRQIVGIESHWDGAPLQPPTTTHQLTASQSLAVFDFLKQLGLPERQLFIMGMGSNRPRHATGGATNRRVEIVIYPEYWDGK